MQIIYYSSEKWFHFAILGMMAYGSIQLQQFYLNKSQIDAKIEFLRQRSNAVTSLSREASSRTKKENKGSSSSPEASRKPVEADSPLATAAASLGAEVHEPKQEDE